MFLINVANPWILLISVLLIMCFLYIGKEAKNAKVALLPLIVFSVLILMHGAQFLMLPSEQQELIPTLGKCLAVDFVMILLTYICYLWTDDIEAKAKKKKSVSSSLECFWKNV